MGVEDHNLIGKFKKSQRDRAFLVRLTLAYDMHKDDEAISYLLLIRWLEDPVGVRMGYVRHCDRVGGDVSMPNED